MDVDITLSTTQLAVTPGEVAELVVEISNLGEARLDILLNVRGVDARWLTLRPPILSIDTAASAQGTILIQPPAEASTGLLYLTVRVVERESGRVLGLTPVQVNVLGGEDSSGDSEDDESAPLVSQSPQNETRKPRAGRTALIIAGVIALVGIAAVGGFLLNRSGADQVLPPEDDSVAAASEQETEQHHFAKTCDSHSERNVSLITDDATTAILMSKSGLTDMRILRTEPAERLPGLFESLLAISGDGERVAYVMADNPAMDETRIMYFDVNTPGDVHEILHLPSGYWPLRPAWSPDAESLAYVQLDPERARQQSLQLDIWIADISGANRSIGAVAVDAETLQELDGSTPLCWSEDGDTLIVNNRTTQIEFDVASSTQRLLDREALADDNRVPVPSGTGCGVPVFSQNDPAWRHLVMQTWGDTIGDFGCALTSTAMVLNYYGAAADPATLNDCLGPYAELLHWNRVPACAPGVVTFRDRADFSWDRLDQVLAKGDPAIVGMVRGQTGMHFVVVTAGGGGNGANYAVTDPWDGSTNKTLQTFFNSGYNPAWVVEFSGSGEVSCERVITDHDTPIQQGLDGSVHDKPVDVGEMVDEDDDAVVIPVWPPVVIPAADDDDPTPIDPLIPDDIDGFVLPPGNQGFVEVVDLALTPQAVTPDLVLDEEGIYFLIVSSTSENGTTSTSRAKFTIDRSPPETGIAASGELVAGAGAAGDDHSVRFHDSADLQVLAHDSLSGVISIDFSLNEGSWERYSDDVSFRRTLSVSEPGEHVIAYRSTDLAGNESQIERFHFTIVTGDQPEPTEVPEPTATPTPQATEVVPTPTPEPTPTPTPAPAQGLEAIPDTLDFGEHPVGGISNSARITLVNTSDHPIQVDEIVIPEGSSRGFVLENTVDCLGSPEVDEPHHIEPGSRCVFSIAFSPEQPGEASAEVIVEHSAEGSPVTIPVSGTGVATFSFVPVERALWQRNF